MRVNKVTYVLGLGYIRVGRPAPRVNYLKGRPSEVKVGLQGCGVDWSGGSTRPQAL